MTQSDFNRRLNYRTPQDDSKLLALADEYTLAVRKYGDALVARDELLEKGVPPLPEVLRIRPRDLELGKNLISMMTSFGSAPSTWANGRIS
jgi:hypothetical protein